MAKQRVAPAAAGESGAPAIETPAAPESLAADSVPALLAPVADSNPRLAELESALAGGADSLPASESPPGAPATPGGPAPSIPGAPPGRPGFKRWSSTKRKNATRKELAARVAELESLVEVTPPPSARGAPAAEPAGLSIEQAAAIAGESIEQTLGIVSGIAKRMRGPHWELTAEERKALGSAWGPVLAPYLGTFAAHLPLVGALTLTASVVWPRIEQDMQFAKLASAQQLPNATTPADAAGE